MKLITYTSLLLKLRLAGSTIPLSLTYLWRAHRHFTLSHRLLITVLAQYKIYALTRALLIGVFPLGFLFQNIMSNSYISRACYMSHQFCPSGFNHPYNNRWKNKSGGYLLVDGTDKYLKMYFVSHKIVGVFGTKISLLGQFGEQSVFIPKTIWDTQNVTCGLKAKFLHRNCSRTGASIYHWAIYVVVSRKPEICLQHLRFFIF